MKIKKLRYRSPSTSLMLAILQIVGGGSLTLLFTGTHIFFRMLAASQSVDPAATSNTAASVSLQLLFLSAIILGRGIWNCLVYGKYRRLSRGIISRPTAVTIKQLTEAMGKSPSDIFSDIRQTMSGRYWSGYGLTETTFVLADVNKNSGTILSGPDMTFRETRRRSRACIGFFAAVWILYLINPGITMWYGYLIAGVLSLLALFISAAILPKKIVISQQIVRAEEHKPEPIKTGVEATDDLLTEGLKYFDDLVALDRSINDEKLDKPVRELLDITRQIFDYVKKQPEKSKQIRQFVNYYLPTTIKLLKNYDELNRQPVKGENIKESIRKIEGIMDGILFTFRQQLDDLYREKNIDISADIAVMENMISQDDVLSGN
jgi:hypothetical protein